MDPKTILAWCDLETTGLDPHNGRILEVAFVFTDLHLNEISSVDGIIRQPASEARALMDDYCIKMHTDNGLLDQLDDEYRALGTSQGYDYYLNESMGVIRHTFEHVKDVCQPEVFELGKPNAKRLSKDVIFVIAGNTIGFDRDWIKVHMPEIDKMMHYRQLDVSSYKVGFPEIFGTATSLAHRAMDDVRASIEQHRKMRQLVLGVK